MATLRGVAIVDDIIFEGDESFIVEIVSLSFGVVGNGATQVEIIDDDGKFIIILYQTPLIPTPMGQKCNVQVLQEVACSWVLTKVSIVKTSLACSILLGSETLFSRRVTCALHLPNVFYVRAKLPTIRIL